METDLRQMIVEQPIRALEACRDLLCLKSFRHFARHAWAVVEGGEPVWEWYHDAICDHLQAVHDGRIKRLLINIPPRMSKSTITSVLWPAWCWLHDPSLRIFAASAVDDVVFRDAERMHDLIDSEWYQKTFAPEWGWKPAQNAKTYFVNTSRGQRISRTVGQTLQGVDADVEIIDDPLDERDAKASARNLREHVNWFVDRALERLTHPDKPVVIIMQRLHELDLSGWCLEQSGWDYLILPAVMEGVYLSNSGKARSLEISDVLAISTQETAEGVPDNVWPLQRSKTALNFADPRGVGGVLSSRLPLSYVLRRVKRPRKFAAKFQQRPAPAEGAIFQKSHIRYWSRADCPDVFDYKIISCDTTFKYGKTNDWVVIQCWGVKGANVYLLSQIRRRMGYDQAVEAMLAMQGKHPGSRATLVEASGNGPSIVAALKSSVPGIQAISVQGDTKESRAAVTLPRWAAGQVYLPHPHEHPWVEKTLIPEILGFPEGRHDDQVDAMTQALVWIGQAGSLAPVVFTL